MVFELPKLSYSYDTLEPYIDAKTMEIHHTKHHQTYITNLNNALKDYPEFAAMEIEALVASLNSVPEAIRTIVRNNAGGHYNHTMFWKLLKKGEVGEPAGELANAIHKKFGTFTAFKEEFTKAAMGRFGSGWAWLSVKNGELSVHSTPNQDNPLMEGAKPLLGLDVWEHAYYLLYQNKRADYITAWWNVVNWREVEDNFL